jgi:hypothetical protein
MARHWGVIGTIVGDLPPQSLGVECPLLGGVIPTHQAQSCTKPLSMPARRNLRKARCTT